MKFKIVMNDALAFITNTI